MASLITFTSLVSLTIAAPSNNGRIIGGLLAPDHSFPYLVGLSITKFGDNGTVWCGGSLIAQNFVLTAAHCVYRGTINIKVKLGAHNRKDIPIIEIQSNDIRIHEEYNPNNMKNDIALIHLPSNVTLTDDILVIQLASRYMDQEFLQGQRVTAAGWGRTADNTTIISENLRFVDVTIISQEMCGKYYDDGLITSSNICIDGSEISGTCNGDSGGPLVYQAADDTLYLVGLTSFGSDHGCEKGYPSAFTRITSFLNWISKHTGLVADDLRNFV